MTGPFICRRLGEGVERRDGEKEEEEKSRERTGRRERRLGTGRERETHGEGKWSRLAPSTGQLVSTAPWLSPEPHTLASHVSGEDRSDNNGSGDTQH